MYSVLVILPRLTCSQIEYVVKDDVNAISLVFLYALRVSLLHCFVHHFAHKGVLFTELYVHAVGSFMHAVLYIRASASIIMFK
jgi:hypothetical protein